MRHRRKISVDKLIVKHFTCRRYATFEAAFKQFKNPSGDELQNSPMPPFFNNKL
jgi:hypothetical protein